MEKEQKQSRRKRLSQSTSANQTSVLYLWYLVRQLTESFVSILSVIFIWSNVCQEQQWRANGQEGCQIRTEWQTFSSSFCFLLKAVSTVWYLMDICFFHFFGLWIGEERMVADWSDFLEIENKACHSSLWANHDSSETLQNFKKMPQRGEEDLVTPVLVQDLLEEEKPFL